MPTPKIEKTQNYYAASETPGGYLQSDQLDRTNAFAAMRLALEAALSCERGAVAESVSRAISNWRPEFRNHADDLREAVSRAAMSGNPRALEAVVAMKHETLRQAESMALSDVPRRADAVTLQARELERVNREAAERHRVRTYNY